MTEPRLQRRLAAIMAADVVGYSRLMDLDEAGTLARLQALRREVFDPRTESYGGRIFKNTGDGALAEFSSATDAVQCALDIQRQLAAQNEGLAEAQRIVLRIGVSLGDVIVDGDDLYGNGVNIAARMEALAEPGDICVSANVHEHVAGAIDADFEDLGEQTVKNLPRPVRSYRLATASDHLPASEPKASTSEPLTPSDKPSIAVLPFTNMSGDPEQEYFSDGITEDIITALSRIRQLFVMARNTSFTYKGNAVDVRVVGRELGVRYVLEGSVRRSGNRVRITVQLINSANGDHLWAERYDRDLEDIFAVQDEITQVVAGAIEPEITKAEIERQRHAPPDNLGAWQLYQRGIYHFYQFGTVQDEAKSIAFLKAAIEKDPGFSAAYSALARAYSRGTSRRLDTNVEEGVGLAIAAASRAVSLDPEDSHAQAAMGFAYVYRDLGMAERAFRDALSLNPNFAPAYFGLAMILVSANRATEAVKSITTAIQLSPRDPLIIIYRGILASAHIALGDDETALVQLGGLRSAERVTGRRSVMRIVALAHLGHEEEMRAEMKRYLEIFPHATISLIQRYLSDLNGRLVPGLRKAGMPE